MKVFRYRINVAIPILISFFALIYVLYSQSLELLLSAGFLGFLFVLYAVPVFWYWSKKVVVDESTVRFYVLGKFLHEQFRLDEIHEVHSLHVAVAQNNGSGFAQYFGGQFQSNLQIVLKEGRSIYVNTRAIKKAWDFSNTISGFKNKKS